MAIPYANPWRPNYEARALAMWLAVAMVAWSTADLWALHGAAFRWVATLALGFALTWLPGTLRLASRQEFLRGYPLEFVAPTDFADQMPQWTGNLWMGKGYDWTAQHTQLALDLMREGPERFAPRDPQRIDPLHSFNRPTELVSRVAALIPSETGR